MNLRDTYNKIAEEWHQDHQADDWWVEGTNKFIYFLKPGDLVLDAGCGGGTKTKYLLEKGLKVVGIDFSENLINIAKKEVPNSKFMVIDMYDMSVLGRDFDGVFAQASLLHIPKKDFLGILRTLSLKLKTNGILYIAVKGSHPGGNEEEIKEENDYGYPYQRFFSYFSTDELIKSFEDIDMKVIYKDVRKVGKTEWIQLIGKSNV